MALMYTKKRIEKKSPKDNRLNSISKITSSTSNWNWMTILSDFNIWKEVKKQRHDIIHLCMGKKHAAYEYIYG